MKVEVFRGADGWRFHVRAGNGEIVSESEGYHNKADAIATAHEIAPEGADVIVKD